MVYQWKQGFLKNVCGSTNNDNCPCDHLITMTKKNGTEKLMVDIHGSISLFLFYLDYLHRLGKI